MNPNDANTGFGIPDAMIVDETPEQRAARLQARANMVAQAEADDEAIAKIVAEARAKRIDAAMPKDTAGFDADYDKLEIFAGQGEHDLAYVPLGINGFVLKVPRGEEVIIPHAFTEVLAHAVEEVTIKRQGGIVTRPAHAFPYNVKGKATADEYKAYQAKQRQKAERQIAQAA